MDCSTAHEQLSIQRCVYVADRISSFDHAVGVVKQTPAQVVVHGDCCRRCHVGILVFGQDADGEVGDGGGIRPGHGCEHRNDFAIHGIKINRRQFYEIGYGECGICRRCEIGHLVALIALILRHSKSSGHREQQVDIYFRFRVAEASAVYTNERKVKNEQAA